MDNVIEFPIKQKRDSPLSKDTIIYLLVGVDDLMPRLDRCQEYKEVSDFKEQLKKFEKELEKKLECLKGER